MTARRFVYRLVLVGIIRGTALVLLAGLIVGLWIFPLIVFAHPGVNDAIELSNLELPLVGAVVVAGFVGLRMARRGRLPVSCPIALGVCMFGAAAVFVLLEVSFGNLSNDRFLPLLLVPFIFAPAGATIVALAWAIPSRRPGDVRLGVVLAGLALALLTIWGLARGARDWLLAPYGVDILLLIALEDAAIFIIAAGRTQTATRAKAT